MPTVVQDVSGDTALQTAIAALKAKIEGAEESSVIAQAVSQINTALGNKQDKLTFDNTPTAGSTKPVTSGGVKAALDEMDEYISSLNIDELQENISGVYEQNYTDGKNLSTTEIIDDPDTCLSDEVPVTWGTSRVAFDYTGDTADAHTYRIWFLDENKNLIQVYGRNPVGTNFRSVVTPDNAAFVLFSFKKGFAGRLYSSNTDVYYTAQDQLTSPGLEQKVGNLSELETSNKDSLVKSINEVKRSNVSLPIKPKDTNFFYVSPNIADPEEFVVNEYVNQTNGQFVSNTAHKRSGYIPVEAGSTYCIVNENAGNSDIRYAFYTSEKVYILGANVRLATVDYVVTAPDNAAYMVISSAHSVWPLMVAKSDELIQYEEFGITYLQPEYLPPYDSMSDVVVNLPSKLYAYVGYELNVYFENIVEDWTKYKWDVTCSKGRQTERGFSITPDASDVGTHLLTIKLYTSDNDAKTVSTALVISDVSAGSGETKSVIILGDSTTYNGKAITKLNENFSDDTMAISTIGTMGTAPNNHEGRSGWKMDDYFTKEYITYPASDPRGTINNSFYNPATQTFDASYYFNNSGVSTPDWFFINMGINDMFSYTSDRDLEAAIDTAIGLFDNAITSIASAAPETKIGVCLTIPPNHSQDAFGKAYSTSQTRNRYKRNNLFWVHRLIEEYDIREDENIYLIPIYTNLDTVYNMGMETLPVNARNTDITYQSPIGNGGVHPVDSGYWQIADVYTAFLKAHA